MIQKTKVSTQGANAHVILPIKTSIKQNVYIHINMKKKIWLGTYGKYKQDISVKFEQYSLQKKGNIRIEDNHD